MFGNNYRPPSGGGDSGFRGDPLDDFIRRHDPLYPFSPEWRRDQQELMAGWDYLQRQQQYYNLPPQPYYPPPEPVWTPEDDDDFDPWEDWDGPYWE